MADYDRNARDRKSIHGDLTDIGLFDRPGSVAPIDSTPTDSDGIGELISRVSALEGSPSDDDSALSDRITALENADSGASVTETVQVALLFTADGVGVVANLIPTDAPDFYFGEMGADRLLYVPRRSYDAGGSVALGVMNFGTVDVRVYAALTVQNFDLSQVISPTTAGDGVVVPAGQHATIALAEPAGPAAGTDLTYSETGHYGNPGVVTAAGGIFEASAVVVVCNDG